MAAFSAAADTALAGAYWTSAIRAGTAERYSPACRARSRRDMLVIPDSAGDHLCSAHPTTSQAEAADVGSTQ